MSGTSKLVRYLLGGVIVGGFWYLNKGRPPWEEAVRTIIVFTIIMTIMKMRLRRRGVEVHLVSLVATKAVLVAVAAVVEYAIEGRVGNATLVVAGGLFVAVVCSGMVGDSFFFGPTTRPATATPG